MFLEHILRKEGPENLTLTGQDKGNRGRAGDLISLTEQGHRKMVKDQKLLRPKKQDVESHINNFLKGSVT